MAEAEWEVHRVEIKRLYSEENKTLAEIRQHMESTHGFQKSKGQYERKFKKWELKKYAMTSQKWKYLAYRIDKRKTLYGKESEVIINGVLYPQEKVKKGILRSGYISTAERFYSAPSPEPPVDTIVFTPAIQFTGDLPLPWIDFLAVLRPEKNQDNIAPGSSLLQLISQVSTLQLPNPDENITTTLRALLPQGKGQPTRIGRTRIASVLKIIMPEESTGQHQRTSALLCSPGILFFEYLKIRLFLLSNNFMLTGRIIRTMSEDDMKEHDELVIKTFQMSGLNTLQHCKMLISMKEATAEALMEQLFASAIRSHNLQLISTMLEVGLNPDMPIAKVGNPKVTPLKYAVGIEDHDLAIDIAKLLLSHGANIYGERGKWILYYATENGNARLSQLLLDEGVGPDMDCLRCAVRSDNISIVRMLLDTGLDVNKGIHIVEDPVIVSAAGRDIMIMKLLLARGADPNCSGFFQGQWATPLGVASLNGDIQMMRLLLDNGANANWKSDVKPKLKKIGCIFRSPLVLAVKRNHVEVVEMLLDAGATLWLDGDIEGHEDQELHRVLFTDGTINNQASKCWSPKLSAMLKAAKRGNNKIVQLLLSAGADACVNDFWHNSKPCTALAAGIQNGNIPLIQTLLSHGAVNLGSKIYAIKDHKTAEFLDKIGALPGILREWGPEILRTSVSRGSYRLTNYLLHHRAAFSDRPSWEFITPLEAKIYTGDIDLSRMMISGITEVGEHEINMAVHKALHTGDTGVLTGLLQKFHGSAPTAFYMAIEHKDLNMVKFLLHHRVDSTGVPGAVSRYGKCDSKDVPLGYHNGWVPKSILERAVDNKCGKIVVDLLKATKWSARLTGRALVFAIIRGENQVVVSLLHAGANLNEDVECHHDLASIHDTTFALQAAVIAQDTKLVQTLITAGADVNHLGPESYQRTALQKAVELGNMGMIHILLGAKANLDGPISENGGATALQIASIQGFLGIAHELISRGAEINAPPAKKNGRTALEGAAEHGRIDMLQFLLNHGALITGSGTRQYKRAIEFAVCNGHYAAANLLRRYREHLGLDDLSTEPSDE